jgi:hypothetical protein
MGIYIAEGSTGNREINFSLHKNEIDYQNRIISYFRNHGYTATLSNRKGLGINISISSTTLAEWFPDWVGDRCYNKRIPNEFMHLPHKKLWALIQGIYDGDGSKCEHEIGQTSEYLALQLVEILHRVGEQPLVRQQISKKLTPKGNKRKIAYCVNWAEEGFDHHSRKGRWKYKDEILTKIKKISKIPFNGKVYNLEVEGDPSYVVNGVVVHNCFGTSYVGGYDGPFEAIIAPPEAEKSIELSDQGLHLRYEYETWTGPFPILNERDVIVRQSNERFLIGPVNPTGIRGTTFQQSFSISYLDDTDIRYDVLIEGGQTSVPESTDLFRTPELITPASPVIPVKPYVPAPNLVKGRTVTFENITF